MTPAWAVRLHNRHAALLGAARCLPGVEVLQDDAWLWLRGADPETLHTPAVHHLPAAGRYTVGDDLALVPLGRRLPVGEMPDGEWAALSVWLTPTAPSVAFAGIAPPGVRLSLVRAAQERPAELLVTSVPAVRQWAERASQLRLSPLSVAIDRERGEVALRGRPLPPLPGHLYTVESGVALPAGYGFAWGVTCAEAARVLALEAGRLALFAPDGSWALLPEDCFIAATRATLRGMSGGVSLC